MKLKWQPVLLLVEKRLECRCGNLAIIVILDEYESVDEEHEDMKYTTYCQDCWDKEQEE